MKKFMRYESVAEMSATLRKQSPLAIWVSSGERTRKNMTDRENKDFAGETFSDAFDLLDNGDAKRAAKIKAEGEILNEAQGGTMPRIEVGVYGCVPSVPNYLRGVPTNMMRVKREPKRNPIIDVYVDTGIDWYIKLKDAAIATAKVANVVTAVEMSGVRVNLYCVYGTHERKDAAGFCVKVKDSRAPLNLLNIAFPMTNSAFCRVVSLHWQECNVDAVWGGHGSLMSAKKCQETFGLKGLTLSIQEVITNKEPVESIAKKFNEYIKKF